MKWQKGQSGNPAGRPKGAVNTVRGALRAHLDKHAQALLEAGIKAALAGDARLLVFFLERLLPVIEEDPVQLEVQDPRFATPSPTTTPQH